MEKKMLNIYIDADGCPVKNEVYKVAARYKLSIFVVANKALSVPLDPSLKMIVVSDGFDAADNWIAEQIQVDDIAITSDILLADRCLKKQARVLGPKGNEFDEDNIGTALAMRDLFTDLRQMGEMRGGQAAMDKNDRSAFLASLDQMIQLIKRNNKSATAGGKP
jgi:uncharacterized protein YaiI (UPF0178 family)